MKASRISIDTALVDLEAWKRNVLDDAKHLGFMEAWEKHLLEIAQAHSTGRLSKARATALLASMLMSDVSIAAHLQSAGDEALRSMRSAIRHPFLQSLLTCKTYKKCATDFFDRLLTLLPSPVIPGLVEADGSPVKTYKHRPFHNWGKTISNVPDYTFVPRSKQGVINIVRWCKQHHKKVRAAGYRHTWSDLYSADGEIFISMLPLELAEAIPAEHPDMNPDKELEGIRIVGTIIEDGKTKALCKIGASTSNEQFRRWCLDPAGGNEQWTIPFNVILVEVTYGGTNAPICHGAGSSSKTLSDLVTEIEFVNAKGDLQTVSDPEQLKAAAGCFGMLGIVTSLTLKLDPMTYANMKPVKKRAALAVPPISLADVPSSISIASITPAEFAAATKEFHRQCEEDYYNEFFWFAFEQECWVHCWNNDGKKSDAVDYPSVEETWMQQLENSLAELLIDFKPFQWLPADVQAKLLAKSAMAVLPTDTTIVAPLIDALHFRRGVRNMRCWDFEMAVPIHGRADDPAKPDWSICQRAWWDAIRTVYELSAQGKIPMRLTLEMRITGTSSVLMAPQHGNTFGSCAIEVLTHYHTPADEWLAFKQLIIDRWTSYQDAHGQRLNSRPHWAKDWHNLTIHGHPIRDYLRDQAYAAVLPDFKKQLDAIAQTGGYTMTEAQTRFGNPVLNDIVRYP